MPYLAALFILWSLRWLLDSRVFFLPEEASMKRYPGFFGLAAVSLVCLLALTACSSGSPTVRFVTVTPASQTINVGDSQQFSAQALYSDGPTKDVTTLASWSSSNTTAAS